MIQIQWSCDSPKLAIEICEGLVRQHLVACAKVSSPMTSIFEWQGKVEKLVEVVVYLKTFKEKFSAVEAYILDRCTDDIPEITAIDYREIHEAYAEWIQETIAD